MRADVLLFLEKDAIFPPIVAPQAIELINVMLKVKEQILIVIAVYQQFVEEVKEILSYSSDIRLQ